MNTAADIFKQYMKVSLKTALYKMVNIYYKTKLQSKTLFQLSSDLSRYWLLYTKEILKSK